MGEIMDKGELIRASVQREVAKPPVLPLDPEALIAKGIEHGISVEGLERLLTMRERLKSAQALAAYVCALAQFQGACPIIARHAIVRDKSGKERYRYAPLESIVKQVGPLLQASDLTYRIDTRIEEGPPTVLSAICTITHREGHSESSEFRVPIDANSYMSEPQKFGAASTYAKRYAFCNALGILTGEQDTDAAVNGQPSTPSQVEPITAEQHQVLKNAIARTGASESRFCAYLKIPSLPALPAVGFDAALAALDRKEAGRRPAGPEGAQELRR